MNQSLSAILRQADGRYLTTEERDMILGYARELPAAVEAGEDVAAQEDAIIDAVLAGLREQYPRFERLFANAWDQFAGNLRLILRADVRAMLSGDMRVLEDKALFYLRSILAAYNVTPQFVRDAFSRLRDQCRDRLRAETVARLSPYLDRNVAVLADFPEPAVAMV